MDNQEIKDERPRFEVNDPPVDWSREEAAFEQVRARLFRDYPGQFVILRFDEVVGPFPTYEEAIEEAYRRFGLQTVDVPRYYREGRDRFHALRRRSSLGQKTRLTFPPVKDHGYIHRISCRDGCSPERAFGSSARRRHGIGETPQEAARVDVRLGRQHDAERLTIRIDPAERTSSAQWP